MPIPLGQAKITVTFDGPSGEVTIKATSQAVPTLDQLASSVGSAVERALADLVGTKALAAKITDSRVGLPLRHGLPFQPQRRP